MRPALIPGSNPRSGSVGVYTWRLARLLAGGLAQDHPVVQALSGRILAITGRATPQRGSNTPAACAWERKSERTPGYLNRRMRRHLIQQTQVALCLERLHKIINQGATDEGS